MKTINQIQDDIIEVFSLYTDWMDKYNYLIEFSNELPLIADEHRTQENLIEGCQSNVWLWAEMKDDKIWFTADSDAIITKGIIALLVKVLSGQDPADVRKADLYFIDQVGLRENLSPTRSNGLSMMLKQMKIYATIFDEKRKKAQQ